MVEWLSNLSRYRRRGSLSLCKTIWPPPYTCTALRYLDTDNAARARRAQDYDQALRGTQISVPKRRPDVTHVYHLYVIRCSERDELQTWLRARGVRALTHYPVPVHLQPAHGGRLQGRDKLPETERVAREVLSLPMFPEFVETELQTVIEAIRRF